MKFITQTINSYLAILLVTFCGSMASLTIINVAEKTTFLTYGPDSALALELAR